jgi:predicted Fe-Mo cluster-binding NifX family protein
MESKVYGHFGSAPAFVIVDTEGNGTDAVDNRDLHHAHGMCNPVAAIGGRQVDAVVVGGIGGGAINKLNAMGVRVFAAAAPTVQENLTLFAGNRLNELSLQHACQHHGPGGCGH